jgi:chromosome segregation ATPase
MERQLSDANERARESDDRARDNERRYQAQIRQLEATIDTDKRRATQVLDDHQRDQERLRSNITRLEKDINVATNDAGQTRKRIDELERQLSDQKRQSDRALADERGDAKQRINDLQRHMDSITKERDRANTIVNDVNDKLRYETKQIEQLRDDHRGCQHKIETLTV